MSFHSGEIFFIENTQNAQILYTHTFTIPPRDEDIAKKRSQRREFLLSEEQFLNGLCRELLR